jgi:hypothetical protein
MAGIDSLTVLMLHCNGVNNSTTFTDSEFTPKAVTPTGNAKISTVQSKFGGASGVFDGSASTYLSVPDSADWFFDTGDFTVDFWIRPNSLPTSGNRQGLFAQYQNNNARHIFYIYNNAGSYEFRWYGHDVSGIAINRAAAISTGNWYHVAAVRYGNIFRIFLDGVQLGADTTFTGSMTDIASAWHVGVEDEASTRFNGWIDEFRVSKGIARWTAPFTPPVAEYSVANTLLSNVQFFHPTFQHTLTSDVNFIGFIQKYLLSDVTFKVAGKQTSILSDVFFTAPTVVISNIANKFNSVLRNLSNINNDFRFTKRVISNINNAINFVKGTLANINNDFRFHLLGINNINNDIRFLKPYQLPGTVGFQSLGKSYIHVYFNSIEQTDVDVDSIEIHKLLNSSHTTSFDLGRAYDNTAPASETIVTIYYDTNLLYKGYVVEVNPAESPEKINVICNDKFWLDNRDLEYFFVGHAPIENRPPNVVETYYDTPKQALQTEASFPIDFGDFVPQIINCFGVGLSDAITSLIEQSGNYAWYFDVDDTRKIWRAGQGSIINIDRQVLASNIKLFDLLNHQFKDDASNIINQYRVQMGNITYNQGILQKAYYQYRSYHQFAQPTWDGSLEILARNSSDGYGWDYPDPEHPDDFKDVFKKWALPSLDPKLAKYSDQFPAYIEIYAPTTSWETMNFNTELVDLVETLTEGFTIDYENGLITFNEPKFLFQTDINGELSAISAPMIKVFIYKKELISYTIDPGNNPLTFTTPKVGTYPTTVTKELFLSDLNKSEGVEPNFYKYYAGQTFVIPQYDDTAFATDMALWQLSKTKEIHKTGTIELTLDTICYYGIDLTKRIFIDGITDAPMNILSIDINLSRFTATLQLENSQSFQRTVSLPWHGE